MKIIRHDDGVQIEVDSGPDVLVTIRQHDEYGFMGSVLTKDTERNLTIVEFHGDGVDGVIVHDPQPYGKDGE